MECLIGPDVIEAILREAASTPFGPIAEVGVYQGGSAQWLATLKRPLFLYDTFTGIPERTESLDAHSIGDFGNTSLEQVKAVIPDATYCVGVFPETFVPQHYSFVHVDCDQYVSIAACISTFGPWMLPGGKMWFDDFPGLAGARKAVMECGKPFRVMVCEKAMIEF